MSKYSPDHYQQGKIQVWDFIEDQDLDFFLGNVVKYICRAGAKPHESELDDLLKAKIYLDKRIRRTQHTDVPTLKQQEALAALPEEPRTGSGAGFKQWS